MSVDQLTAMTQSDSPWVRGFAQQALLIQGMCQRGEITEDEQRELLVDLARSEQLEQQADDLEMKTMLVTAIYAVAQVA